jgi:hypothetical protein
MTLSESMKRLVTQCPCCQRRGIFRELTRQEQRVKYCHFCRRETPVKEPA